jgi:hypothetical protein
VAFCANLWEIRPVFNPSNPRDHRTLLKWITKETNCHQDRKFQNPEDWED